VTRSLINAYPSHVLIVTQHDDAGLRDAAIEAGARGFVLKDDLLALVISGKTLKAEASRKRKQRSQICIVRGENYVQTKILQRRLHLSSAYQPLSIKRRGRDHRRGTIFFSGSSTNVVEVYTTNPVVTS
jgi:hypothetical protein